MIKYANNLSDKTWRNMTTFQPIHKMSIDNAILFVTFYEEDGETGWRLPTEAEALDNSECQGCWHQGDLSPRWPSNECYFVRPVKDIE